MAWLEDLRFFFKMLLTPGKSTLQVEIEVVQFLGQHGESFVNDIHEALNVDFDMNTIRPGTFASFGAIYAVLIDLEEYDVVRSRLTIVNGKKRLLYKLTGRGPQKLTYSSQTALSLQPGF